MTTVTVRPVAWSHSALQCFLNCSKMYYHINVAKDVKDFQFDPRLWGSRVHKFFEQAVGTDTVYDQPCPPEFEHYLTVVARLRTIPGEFIAEQQLAITKSFQPTKWFAPDVWCRAILDATWCEGKYARVLDYKTGKRKLDPRQLILQALLLFAHRPEIERINSGFLWLQQGKLDVEHYQRCDIPRLWQEFLPDVRRLEYAHRSQAWTPRPSGLCHGYCPVRSCSFWDGKSQKVQNETDLAAS